MIDSLPSAAISGAVEPPHRRRRGSAEGRLPSAYINSFLVSSAEQVGFDGKPNRLRLLKRCKMSLSRLLSCNDRQVSPKTIFCDDLVVPPFRIKNTAPVADGKVFLPRVGHIIYLIVWFCRQKI